MFRWAEYRKIVRVGVLAGVAIFVLASTPNAAGEIALSDPALTIEVSSADGSAVLEVALQDMIWDPDSQVLAWNPGHSLELADADSAVSVAVLESLQFQIEECGKISLSLGLRAGAHDVTVNARSGLLEFPAVAADQAQARASASFTVRDLDADGSYFYGLPGDGTGAFRAYYNGDPGVGTRFAHLVALISAGSGSTASASQSSPAVGYRDVGHEVRSLELELAFLISDHDRMSASTLFDVEPDPGICGLDSDGDGVPDWLDGCPDNPELTQPGDDGCGSPQGNDDPNGVIVQPDDEETSSDPVDDSSPVESPAGDSPAGDSQTSSGENVDSSGDAASPGSPASGESVSLEQIDQLLGGGVAPCGAGMVGLLPVMILGIAGAKLGSGRRRD